MQQYDKETAKLDRQVKDFEDVKRKMELTQLRIIEREKNPAQEDDKPRGKGKKKGKGRQD